MSPDGNPKIGMHQVILQWERIKVDLATKKPVRMIHEELKQEGLYNYSYQSFAKTIKRKLQEDSSTEDTKPAVVENKPLGRQVQKAEKPDTPLSKDEELKRKFSAK